MKMSFDWNELIYVQTHLIVISEKFVFLGRQSKTLRRRYLSLIILILLILELSDSISLHTKSVSNYIQLIVLWESVVYSNIKYLKY